MGDFRLFKRRAPARHTPAQVRQHKRQRDTAYRQRLIVAGLCINCREERGSTGTSIRCRECADFHSGKPLVMPADAYTNPEGFEEFLEDQTRRIEQTWDAAVARVLSQQDISEPRARVLQGYELEVRR